MPKEMLSVEFRYFDSPVCENGGTGRTTTVTIGIYDGLERAVAEGNDLLGVLSEYFEVRADDKFKVKGLFGLPDRLVTNCCYPTKGVQYFAKITRLDYTPLREAIQNTFLAHNRYVRYQGANE